MTERRDEPEPEGRDGPEPGGTDEPELEGVELWLAPFFRDPTLWPVSAVVICIAVTLGTSALLLASEGNLFASAALVIAFWIGFDAGLRQWRRGSRLLAGLVAGFWTLAGAAAWLVHRAGWF